MKHKLQRCSGNTGRSYGKFPADADRDCSGGIYGSCEQERKNFDQAENRKSAAPPAELSHDRKKRYILEEGTFVPFLNDLGVMTEEGKIVRTKTDKFRHSPALENTRLWCLMGQTFLRSSIQGEISRLHLAASIRAASKDAWRITIRQ